MLNLLVEPFSELELGATANSALGAPILAYVEMVSARPDRVELRVPGELKAISTAEKLLALAEADIPAETREAIMVAFRETLGNAIEHGCQMDAAKHVEVSYVRLRHAFVCRIKDPGQGFDPARLDHGAICNPEVDQLRHAHVREEKGMRPGGFGMLLTSKRVDELVYNERHNEVIFVKYLADYSRDQNTEQSSDAGLESTERL